MKIYTDVPLWLPRNRVRRPDLMVFDERPAGEPVVETPLLIVEVLSPGTHTVDLLEKSPEYAEAGIPQLWIADPEARSVEIYRLSQRSWELALRVDEFAPSGTIAVDGRGEVALCLDDALSG